MKPFTYKLPIFLTGLIIITTFAASAANRYSVATDTWASTATWSATSGGASGASAPVAGDVVFIQNNFTVTVGAAAACATLNIASGSTLTVGGFTLTVSGATSLSGTMTFNSATGTKTFTGNVTINSTGNWNETAAAVFAFGGNLQNDGTFTASTGTHTFSGTTKTISGANPIAIPSLTISGTTTNNGTLTVSTTLAGGSTLTNGATGTLNYGGSTSIAPTLTATAAGNTVNYTRPGNQTVKPTTYSNLTVSGSGAKTTSSVTVNGIMTMAGTASVSPVPTYGANATLTYDGSAAQLPGVEFPASFTGTGGVVSNNPLGVTMNAIKTVSSLTVNAGAVFNTGATSTWALTVSGATSVSGTLNLTNVATKTFTGNITVNSGGIWSIDNTTSAILATNITVSAGGIMRHYVNYASSNIITMTGNLDISGTYNYTGFTPAIFMNAPSGTRTINTGTTSVFYLLLRTATYNAVGPVTVDGPFYAMWNVNAGSFHTNGQTIIANWGVVNAGGTLFVDGGSLTINGANGGLLSANTLGGANSAVTVSSGTLNTTGINMGLSPFVSTFTHSGGTITTTSLIIDNTSTYTCSNSPSLTVNGTVSINSGSFTTASTGTPVIISGDLVTASGGTFGNIAGCSPNVTINGNVTNTGTLTPRGTAAIGVKGNWTNNGTSTATGGTVTFNGTGNQAIGGTSVTTFGSIVINPSAGITVSLTRNISVLSNLTVSTGIFDLGSFTANRASSGGTLAISGGAALKIGGTNTIPSNYSAHSMAATSTVEYSGTTQSLAVLNSAQDYGNLTISGSATKTLAGNENVRGVLTFTSSTITTGANSLYLTSTGSVSRTSGHVIGNFRKYFAIGATNKTFEIGDATNYSPVIVAFASVTTAGDLTGSTAAGDHANIGSSAIDPTKTANRNWTLTNSGIVFTTYSVTLTFVAGDLDPGAITNNFSVGKYSAAWSSPTVGSKTTTSTQATGIAAFSDFQVGEIFGGALPVQFTSVKAIQKNKDILVKWDIAEESGIREYGVEQSVDGINFSKVGGVTSKGNSAVESYEWLDINPVAGNNYYRIRAAEIAGNYFLSKMVVVKMEANIPEVRVFPSPVKNSQINLYINSGEKGQYTVILSGPTGQQIIKQVIDHPGGSLSRIISLNKKLAGGIYHLRVTNKTTRYHQTIMIE